MIYEYKKPNSKSDRRSRRYDDEVDYDTEGKNYVVTFNNDKRFKNLRIEVTTADTESLLANSEPQFQSGFGRKGKNNTLATNDDFEGNDYDYDQDYDDGYDNDSLDDRGLELEEDTGERIQSSQFKYN